MSEEKQKKTTETLTVNRPKKLQLTKTVEGGKVKQNFTHGRSKTVTVEVRKTRTFTRRDDGGMTEDKNAASSASSMPDSPAMMQPQVRDKEQIQKATREVKAPAEQTRREKSDVVSAPAKEQPEQKLKKTICLFSW